MVEGLCAKCKVLSSNASTTGKKKKTLDFTVFVGPGGTDTVNHSNFCWPQYNAGWLLINYGRLWPLRDFQSVSSSKADQTVSLFSHLKFTLGCLTQRQRPVYPEYCLPVEQNDVANASAVFTVSVICSFQSGWKKIQLSWKHVKNWVLSPRAKQSCVSAQPHQNTSEIFIGQTSSLSS